MELLNVFVSYCHEDEAFARRFSEVMASVGIPHFIDSRVEVGENFERRIQDAIAQATHFVCVISSHSTRSPWVHYELDLARHHGVRTLPILIEPGVALKPVLPDSIKYICVYNHSISDDDLCAQLIEAGMFNDGIVPVGLFRRYKHCFPREFFASELLTQPLFLRREGQKVIVRVNRSGVKYVVISDVGKKRLCERFVKPRLARWTDLDRTILSFMRDPTQAGPVEIPTSELPLRWASGGVLSLVNWKGSEWVPLFFRDIPPYGWNLSLGATERYFDDNDYEISDSNYSLEYELCQPWKFIVREFLEETLVLSDYPHPGPNCQWRCFDFSSALGIALPLAQAQHFAQNHLDLRRNQDGLDIGLAPARLKVRVCDDTAIDLEIARPGTGQGLTGVWDVLVAINPVELGIEVIKVFQYDLSPSDCILDGEVYRIGNHRQMVRMPIGLISLRYLYENFGASDYQLQFTEEPVHPSVRGAAFKAGDIHVCRWDIDRRAHIWGGERANNWEKDRFSQWQVRFDAAFAAGVAGDGSKFPPLFTPASVKALNLFCNCSTRGQTLGATFRRE